jgi:preprotein translocase subunit SecE
MSVTQKARTMNQKSSSAATAKGKKSQNGFLSFFGEVKGELKRITWTGKEELQLYTKIVVMATFVLGMAIYASDLFVRSTLGGLGAIFRMIFG